jgi:hypothetical protein
LLNHVNMENACLNCIAFDGIRRIAFGPLADVAPTVKEYADAQPLARILVFNAETSEPIEIDCRGSLADVMRRIAPVTTEASPPDDVRISQPAGRGRPKLGVVAREVTLLPRHWEWLGTQPGGASVALRKLVEQARRASSAADRIRQSQDATNRFMTAMAGDMDGYEEASRALFAADRQRFESLLAAWPEDIRAQLLYLAKSAFQAEGGEEVDHA